jgi:Domain of unknown function (DUF4911)
MSNDEQARRDDRACCSGHPCLKTVTFAIPPARIALFKAIIESYDNLATLRTEDPLQHHLKLYFAADAEAEVRALLDSMRDQFEIRELGSGV